MALTTSTPLIALCYHEKTRDFMKNYGIEKYALDDEALTCESFLACAEQLISNGAALNEMMKVKSTMIAKTVESDLRDIIKNEL